MYHINMLVFDHFLNCCTGILCCDFTLFIGGCIVHCIVEMVLCDDVKEDK